MKDFYQRLHLPPSADDTALGRAIESAAPQLRRDAEFILLNPARRKVYDRNLHLLRTIGQLRMHLGLNYTRFWARQEYKDFAQEAIPPEKPRGRPVSSIMIANAITRVGRRGRHQTAKPRNWAMLLTAALVLAGLLIVVWRLRR